MRKKKTVFISILLLYMIFMIFFFYSSQKTHKNRNLKKINIIMDPLSKDHFVNEEIINKLLKIEKIEKKIGQLCIFTMEKKLNNYPFIKKSEVFLSVDGTLNIKILQKEPILRIKNGNKEYYLTKEAENLELSSIYSSKVLLAKGSFSKEEKKHLADLVQTINSDEFLKNQIISIKKTVPNLFVLIPKIGNHHIILGNIKDFKSKLNKLKAFYKQYLNKIDMNQYQSIDLQYKDQVVAKKR
ncbi:cell division protein FtsQ [Blattabacterium sp. (Periplaneta americana) str. BPLAN]|nr:cell division protein FtsQ [Blattabacterium sp. (Periplaneta americana) str. BPLAN]